MKTPEEAVVKPTDAMQTTTTEPTPIRRLSDDRRARAVSAVSSQTPPSPALLPKTVPAPVTPAQLEPPVQQPAPATNTTSRTQSRRQTQAPYQPYPYPYVPQHPRGRSEPILVPFNKEWMRIKFVLTIVSILFCIILLAMAMVIAGSYSGTYRSNGFIATWSVPFTVITIVWNFAEIITVCSCGSRPEAGAMPTSVRVRRGIHPGAHVALNLLIWLAGVFCIFIATLGLVSGENRLVTCRDYISSSSTSTWYYSRCTTAEYYFMLNSNYLGILRAIVAFVCLITAVHFFLFVRACIETHQYNTSARLLIVPHAMYYGGSQQGMMPYPGPNMYQMPLPHTPVAQPHGAPVTSETQAATLRHQQEAYGQVSEFYAPPLPPRRHDFAGTSAAARSSVPPPPVAASSSMQQPTVASSSTQAPAVETSRI